MDLSLSGFEGRGDLGEVFLSKLCGRDLLLGSFRKRGVRAMIGGN